MFSRLYLYAFFASFSYIISCLLLINGPDLLPFSYIAAGVAIGCVAFIVSCIVSRLIGLRPLYSYLLFCLLSLCVAYACLSWKAQTELDLRLPEQLDNKSFYVEGRVLGLPAVSAKQRVFDFEVYKTELPWRDQQELGHPRKIRLSVYQPLSVGDIKGGASYRFLVKLRRPRGSLNFTGFDYERWLFTEGYHAKGYVKHQGNNKLLGTKAFSISGFRESLRQKLYSSDPSQARALVVALVLGDRSTISKDNKELLVHTGVAHLLAISGMHIGLLALTSFISCFYLLKLTAFLNQLRRKGSSGKTLVLPQTRILIHPLFIFRTALIFSLLVSCAYAVISGFGLPAQRVLIMLCCYGFAHLFLTQINYFVLWYIALVLVLLFQPYAVCYAGFYLSFAAVLLIQCVLLSKKPHLANGFFAKLRLFIAMQFYLLLCMAPLTLYFFGGWFITGLLANLIAVPLVSFFVLPASLLASSFEIMNLGYLSSMIFTLVDFALTYLLVLLNYLHGLLFVDIAFFLPLLSAIILFVTCLLFLLPLPWAYKGSCWVFVLAAFAYVFKAVPIPENEFRLRMLDVGQGLSVIIETRNHLLLYDAGPAFGEHFDAGESIVVPAFTQNGQRKIDTLVISHGDQDHMGGAMSVLSAMRVRELMSYPESIEKRMHPWAQQTSDCREGQRWTWDGVNFEVLAPFHEENLAKLSSNNRSCVIKVSTNKLGVLLTGDIDSKREARLIRQYGELLKAEILIVPHHGSKTSSSEAFLKTVSPFAALGSAAWKHHFGHPHPDVVQRYQAQQIEYFNTAHLGEIQFSSWEMANGSGFEFARKRRQRFWR